MDKASALELLMLLSALESWAFSSNTKLPDYLHERIGLKIDELSEIVLQGGEK